jgi:D-alanyl-D-alanine carboxypeptidase
MRSRPQALALTAAAVLAACGPAGPLPVTGGPGEAPAGFAAVAQAAPAPGLALALEGPQGRRAWAAGYRDRSRRAPLLPDSPVRIASVTKTFLAAALLRLAEDGRLDLDAPVSDLLSGETRALLEADGYQPAAITTRQLLAHTAGIADHWGMDLYQLQARYWPGKRWTRQEQLRFAMRHGDPVGAPGERFAYSDTGYLLAAEVLERASGLPMAQAVRTLLGFERLGLGSTWFETLEPPPAGAQPMAMQFIGWQNGSAIHASFDLHGAGGLVSTAPDLARFFAALGSGKVFQATETLTVMATPTPQSLASGSGYGLGLSTLVIGAQTCHGHGGFWGHIAWVCPESGTAGAAFVTDTQAGGYLGQLMAP